MKEQEVRSATITPLQMDIFTEFNNRWQNDISLVHETPADHPDFKRIVAMGQDVIPLILEDIKVKPSWLVMALGEITGESPVKAKENTDLEDICDVWVAWGEERRYIEPVRNVA